MGKSSEEVLQELKRKDAEREQYVSDMLDAWDIDTLIDFARAELYSSVDMLTDEEFEAEKENFYG